MIIVAVLSRDFHQTCPRVDAFINPLTLALQAVAQYCFIGL